MTPLAHRIVKELTLPVKRRTFVDRAGILRRMGDVHCFEISEIEQLAADLGAEYPEYGVRDELIFLPFPKTWIEMKTSYGRVGYLVEELADRYWRVTEAWQSRNGKWASDEFFFDNKQRRLLSVRDDERSAKRARTINAFTANDARRYHSSEWFRAVFAIINTPRIIGRRQHMPHRGLERRLVAAQKLVGKFPLHSFTEIKLTVAAPRDASRDRSVEAHYTGMVAYHWCRAHLRIRLGKLELVKAHERGNVALGFKQRRYKLVA